MEFGWWVKTYFKVLFSREIWFSWFFIIFEVLVLLGVVQHEDPILQAIKGICALFIFAVFLTTAGMLQATLNLRIKRRVEKETAERMAAVRERLQPMLDARLLPLPQEPIEPKQSPWFLGAWGEYLGDKEQRN